VEGLRFNCCVCVYLQLNTETELTALMQLLSILMTDCTTLATLYPEICELIIPSCFAVAAADFVNAFFAALPIWHVETPLQ
jgi:hypothetical protein